MKTFLLLCLLISSSSLGEIILAKGMQQIGDVSLRPRALLGALWRMMRNPWLFAGVACMAVSFFSFISLLSYADLSFVVPLTAVSYITNTIGARFFLNERISRARWLGTLLVAGGVVLISLAARIEALFAQHALAWWRVFYNTLAPTEVSSPILFWILLTLRFTLLICVIAALIYYIFATIAGLLWFADRRRQRALGLNYTPPITIFKPARGLDTEAYENFASFCRQDYPDYQIIFGVRNADDPVLPIIRQLQTDFPACDIELIVSTNEFGYNAKISNLQNMYAHARHDVLLIADSDIRVTPDYLRRVVAPLQQSHVGMVTCLYRGARAQTFAALLKNIGISSTFAPEVCASRTLEGIAFALGSTIIMRRGLLESGGGFAALANYLADDFLLGSHAAHAGYEVVLADYVVEHVAQPDTFGAVWRHLLRWGRTMRRARPGGYHGLIFTYGTATALLALLVWGFAAFAWWLLGLTLLLRMVPVFVVGVYGLRDRVLARYWWLVPLRDLLTCGVWIASFVGDEIEWRGARFRVLRGGKLAPLSEG
jgi:ceramide glucosyltransferase